MLGDRYALGEVIGRGGMADVYRAEGQLLGREVAIKVMPHVASNANEDERFMAEARTLAGLDHPNLVTVLDVGTSEVSRYLVLELVEGSSLSRYRGQAMDPMRVAAMGRDLADALSYVHRQGIVHRDIKPGNILLDGEGRVRLADFGIARSLSDGLRHTATGVTIEALTGERMYEGTPMVAALARLDNPPRIPAMLSDGWKEVLSSMTAFEPEDRATAFEVTQLLGALASREVGLAPTGGEPSLVTHAESAPAVIPEREASASTPHPGHAPALAGIQADG